MKRSIWILVFVFAILLIILDLTHRIYKDPSLRENGWGVWEDGDRVKEGKLE